MMNRIKDTYINMKLSNVEKTHMPNSASLFLIESSPLKNNLKILELGAGSGHVSIAISKMFENSIISCIEIQKSIFDSLKINLNLNNCKNIQAINDDVKNIKNYFESDSFDLIISNPPHYFGGRSSEDKSRFTARTFDDLESLNGFFYATKYALKNKKMANFVIHPSIFSPVISMMKNNKLEPHSMMTAYGNKNNNAQFISILCRKNGGTHFYIKPPYFLK